MEEVNIHLSKTDENNEGKETILTSPSIISTLVLLFRQLHSLSTNKPSISFYILLTCINLIFCLGNNAFKSELRSTSFPKSAVDAIAASSLALVMVGVDAAADVDDSSPSSFCCWWMRCCWASC